MVTIKRTYSQRDDAKSNCINEMNETRKANNRDVSPASDVQLILGRNCATL